MNPALEGGWLTTEPPGSPQDGTFFMVDEPALTGHNRTETSLHFHMLAMGAVHLMGLGKWVITCVCDIQSIFTALKPLYVVPIHTFPLLLQTPFNHYSFYCLHSLAFPRIVNIVGILTVCSPSDELLSLSNIKEPSLSFRDLIAYFF